MKCRFCESEVKVPAGATGVVCSSCRFRNDLADSLIELGEALHDPKTRGSQLSDLTIAIGLKLSGAVLSDTPRRQEAIALRHPMTGLHVTVSADDVDIVLMSFQEPITRNADDSRSDDVRLLTHASTTLT